MPRKKSAAWTSKAAASSDNQSATDSANLCPVISGQMKPEISSREEIEKALLESEAKYSQLVESSPDAIVSLDPNGRILTFNKAASSISGYTKEEVLGKKFTELGILSSQSAKLGIKLFERLMVGYQIPSTELIVIRKDGARVVVEATPRVLGNDREITGLQVILRDISERKKADKMRVARTTFLANLVGINSVVDIAQLAFEHIGSLMPCDTGALLLWSNNDPEKPLEIIYSVNIDDLGNKRINKNRTSTALPAESSIAKCLSARHELIFQHRPEKVAPTIDASSQIRGIDNPESKSRIYWPLQVHGRVIGAIIVQSHADNAFNKVQISLIESTAADIALALAAALTGEALIQNEKRYASLYNNAQVGLFRTRTIDGKLLECNEYFAKMAGYASVEDCVLNWDPAQRYADPEVRLKLMQILQAEDTFRDFEAKFVRTDGITLWARYSGKLIRDKGFIEGAAINVTEEKTVREEIQKFKLGLERSGEAIFLTDIDGIIVYVNPAFEKIYGYSKDEALGKTPRILKSGLLSEEIYRNFWNTLFARQAIAGELVNKAKDGRLLTIDGSANPVLDNDGKLVGFLAIQRDITERKQAEKLLQVEKAYLEQLFESSPEAIILTDNSGKIIKNNSEFTRMFGYSLEETVGRSVDDLICSESSRADSISLTRKIAEGQSISLEAVRYRKDGSPVDVSILGTPITVDGGQVAVYGIYRDITKRKKSEEINRARTEFLSQLVGHTNATELARLAFQHISHFMPCDAGGLIVAFGDSQSRQYEVVYSFDTDERGRKTYAALRETLDLQDDTCTSRIFHNGQKEIIHRSAEEQRQAVAHNKNIYSFNERKSRSLAFLPLKIHGQVIGVLSVQSYDADVFDEFRVAMLESTAADLALALTAARMTDALKDSEEYLKIILSSVQAGIAVIDPQNHTIIDANSFALNLLGMTKDEIVGRKWCDVICAGQHETCETFEGQYNTFREHIIARAHGEQISILKSVVPVTRKGRQYLLVSFIDNTERKRALEAMRDSEEKYRNLVETMPNGVSIADLEDNLVFVNSAACRILGYPNERLIGSNLKTLVPDYEKSKLAEAAAMRVQGEQSSYELEIRRGDGQLRSLLVSGTPLLDSNGAIRLTLGIFSDITDAKNSETEKQELRDKLSRAQRMESLGVLAGGVAHDLNNILGPLVAYPELIRMKLPPDSPIARQISKIEVSAQRAAEVVQDLLTMARRGRYEMTILNFNKIIETYLQSPDYYDLKMRFPAIMTSIELDRDVSTIYGSEPHLYKVIMNLVINAFDAMPHGGAMTIKTECRSIDRLIGGYDNIEGGKYNILTIKDTGIGISSKDLKRIFEPFYTKKEMGKSGSGLGLAIVYGVIKDHNGYIDVKSKPNQGSDFILYLPAVAGTPIQQQSGSVDIRGNEHVLVVDDVPEQRELAATVLSSLGYKVDIVANGHEAVEYLHKSKADVVILDMIMEPGFDGLDTYKEIIKIYPRQRAIVTSGFSETDRVKEAEKLGVGKYIRKPYTMQKLGKAIREILAES